MASCTVMPAPTSVTWSPSEARTTWLSPISNRSSGPQITGVDGRMVRR